MTLRIAVPNKGSLSLAATDILRESGYRQRPDSKELALVDTENDVEFFYLRPRDIALYVGEGTLDAGITGRDLLLDSQAVLVTRGGQVPADFDIFRRRIEGVLVARSFVMMDYDIEESRLDAATELAPGREGPTISPLGKPGWVAVRVMVPRAGSQRLMDDLWSTGARAILLTDIHACRL